MRLLAIAAWAVFFTPVVFANPVQVLDWKHGSGEPSYYTSPVHHSPQLLILGAYEGTDDHAVDGVIRVNVRAGTDPLVLLCSSYESVLWNFSIEPGANVQRIILNGYEPQQITGAANVEVINLSPYLESLGEYGYAYPPQPHQADTNLLIAQAESYTGMTLEGFGGAYQPHAFVVPEPALVAGACVVLLMTLRANRWGAPITTPATPNASEYPPHSETAPKSANPSTPE